MNDNMPLHVQLLYKKVRDMKLKTKIRLALFAISVFTVAGIGIYSYQIAKRELLKNSKDALISMEKQGGKNLDDRISAFQDVSYRIIQAENIAKLLNYTPEEAAKNRIANEGLPAAISQQSSLYRYTKYAFLRPNSGEVYDYYKSGQDRLPADACEKLLDELDAQVDRNRPVRWTMSGNEVFFVRQVVDSSSFEDKGLLCFAVDQSFFEFISGDTGYLNNGQTIVLEKNGGILKRTDDAIGNSILQDRAAYQDKNQDISQNKNYYVYQYTKETEDDTYTVAAIQTEKNRWTVIVYFSHSVLLKGIQMIYAGVFRTVIIAALIVLSITALISRTITKNVRLIEEGMRQYEAGCFEHRISPASYDEVGLLGLQLNHMAVKISELIQMLHLEEEEKKQKEIETLQAQINPHFLYNTLGSLKWAAFRNGQKDLAGALDALSSLLRFTIKKAGGMVTVSEEIAYIKNYIAIERMRYGDAFSVVYDLDDAAREMQIPGFILQPLVENCFLHGLDMAAGGGVITVRSSLVMDGLVMQVEDNGEGIPKERLDGLLLPDTEKEKKYKGFSSIGLSIVDRRLKEMYGERYRTAIHSLPGEGTVVSLHIPLLR
ncbi:MAG: histidine kinase [Eubacterium sp.]|nr:histidine kinase [Eubacterium sp.]